MMQPTTAPTHPPKDDPFTASELAQYDGSDDAKPVYVCIKGQIFDVSEKREMYLPGKGYHIFAGKDGSKGLGLSSLKPEDAIADYSELDEKHLKVLDDWVSGAGAERFDIYLQVEQRGEGTDLISLQPHPLLSLLSRSLTIPRGTTSSVAWWTIEQEK